MADLKPIYKRIGGEWVKQTAYQRQSGEWVQISGEEPVASMYLYGTPSDSGNIGLRSGESVSYYDGAVLPDINCLLTAEQKAKYPFLWINGPFNAGRSYRMYALPKVEVRYSSFVHWFGVWGDDASYITAVCEDGQWGEATEKTGGTNTFVGAGIWKNFDISYESEVLSSASPAPIPVSGIVAYSYNGTVLPELPEWDKEAYPYAFLTKLSHGNTYYLTVIQEYSFGLSDANEDVIVYPTTAMRYRSSVGGTSWVEGSTSLNGQSVTSGVLWANFDVLIEDGTVFLAASNPVPVYE